jgi:hypothetical protein
LALYHDLNRQTPAEIVRELKMHVFMGFSLLPKGHPLNDSWLRFALETSNHGETLFQLRKGVILITIY